MRLRKAYSAGILAVIVLISGCISAPHGHSSTSSSTASKYLIRVPPLVSFNATLAVESRNETLLKSYYAGVINYQNNTANVTISSVYRPSDQKLTGNWHTKRIIIGSDGSVKIFVSPPASWIPIAENETQSIKEDVFDHNPYSILFDLLKNRTQCSNCTFSVTLSHEEALSLLGSLTSKDELTVSSLNGTVVVKNGTITSAVLKGTGGDKVYTFKLEVEEE
jgi:hypothetical protein